MGSIGYFFADTQQAGFSAFLAMQQDAPCLPAFLAATLPASPQQSLGPSQQASPFTQHAGGLAPQQARFSAQHFIPLAQQPGFFSALQQAFCLSQHASFRAQQSPSFWAGSAAFSAANTPPAITARANKEPNINFGNMVEISFVKDLK